MIPDAKAARAIAMWEAGKTTTEIAAALGCTRQWARKLLVKVGIDVRKKPTPAGVDDRRRPPHPRRPKPRPSSVEMPGWASAFDEAERHELAWLVEHAGLVIDEIPPRTVPLVVATIEAGVQRQAAHRAWTEHLDRHRRLAADTDGAGQVERAQRAAVQARHQWVELLRSIGMSGQVFDRAEEEIEEVGVPAFEVVK